MKNIGIYILFTNSAMAVWQQPSNNIRENSQLTEHMTSKYFHMCAGIYKIKMNSQ